MTAPLAGKSVLVVEDDPVLALELEAFLKDIGATKTAIVDSAAAARKKLKLKKMPDLCILDFHVTDGTTEFVAALLNKKGIPFVALTGRNGAKAGVQTFNGGPLLQKPHTPDTLIAAIKMVMSTPRRAA